MTRTARSASSLISLLAMVLNGCGSAKRQAEGIEELRRRYSAVQDMDLVVSAGTTEAEYSTRLTDALLKFGNPGDWAHLATGKFGKPEQRALASEACVHMIRAMDAYTLAKEYHAQKYIDDDLNYPDYVFGEKDYADAKGRFADLEELPIAETNEAGYKFYSRSAMLQALWKVAAEESQTAKGLVEKLAQM